MRKVVCECDVGAATHVGQWSLFHTPGEGKISNKMTNHWLLLCEAWFSLVISRLKRFHMLSPPHSRSSCSYTDHIQAYFPYVIMPGGLTGIYRVKRACHRSVHHALA